MSVEPEEAGRGILTMAGIVDLSWCLFGFSIVLTALLMLRSRFDMRAATNGAI
jgi:hypothetical protein